MQDQLSAQRVIRSYRQKINAPAAEVFPLICPVREAEWLDGWDYRMIYSESGVAEEGCIFTSRHTGDEFDTIWMIIRHDPIEKTVEFTRITPGSRTAKLTVKIADIGDGKSRVEIEYVFTALNERGNTFLITELTKEKFRADMKFWEDSMNHWLKTGERLKAGGR
ncbi:MAG: SRPBCC family protein [FCB group bacterium]|nr:SRPBCC family protein [FCB group bacterium]